MELVALMPSVCTSNQKTQNIDGKSVRAIHSIVRMNFRWIRARVECFEICFFRRNPGWNYVLIWANLIDNKPVGNSSVDTKWLSKHVSFCWWHVICFWFFHFCEALINLFKIKLDPKPLQKSSDQKTCKNQCIFNGFLLPSWNLFMNEID